MNFNQANGNLLISHLSNVTRCAILLLSKPRLLVVVVQSLDDVGLVSFQCVHHFLGTRQAATRLREILVVELPPAPGSSVVDDVDRLTELRQDSDDTAGITFVTLLPVTLIVDTLRRHNQVLRIFTCSGLLCSHHTRSHENAIRGHLGSSERNGPLARQPLPAGIRITKTASNDEHHVGTLPDLGVSRQQWLKLVFKRMVSTCSSPGPLNDHVKIRILPCEGQHLLDCVSRSRLEANVPHATALATGHDLPRLLGAWDACGNRNGINRFALGAQLLNLGELEAPQIRVQEQQIAADAEPRRNNFCKISNLLLKQMRQRNATASQLTRVPSLIHSSNLLVMTPRRHPRHNDWRGSQQARQSVVDGWHFVRPHQCQTRSKLLLPAGRHGQRCGWVHQRRDIRVGGGRLAIRRREHEGYLPPCQILASESCGSSGAPRAKIHDHGRFASDGSCGLVPIKELVRLHVHQLLQKGTACVAQIAPVHR
mmetsp:Transcript_42559/g.102544  ORF Transcript_42559/g.102544 Transcript_42559/m.102544 type:complete len:482 (+) Transcript_42559:9154-10599(+)